VKGLGGQGGLAGNGVVAPLLTEIDLPDYETIADMVEGPDGNLWFVSAAFDAGHVGRLTADRTITEFNIPAGADALPRGIAVGPDQALWFTEFKSSKIGRITTAGDITEVALASTALPWGITSGPDGNLWFTEQGTNAVGRMTLSGVVDEFPIPTAASEPFQIARGADGNLWFAEELGKAIGRITPGGTITEFPVATFPSGVALGSDGNLWMPTVGGIRRVTPSGMVTSFAAGAPQAIASGLDGNLWFTSGVVTDSAIGCLAPSGALLGLFPLPTGSDQPTAIAAGAAGDIWFAESIRATGIEGNRIAHFKVSRP